MLDRINLLPEEIKNKRRARTRNYIIMLGIISYVGLIIVIYSAIYIMALSAKDDLEDVKLKRAALRAKISQYTLFEEREKELITRKASLAKVKDGDIGWSSVMYRLSLLLPPQVWLSSFETDGLQLNLSGYSLDLKGVAGTALQLVNLKEFEDRVELKDVKKDTEETNALIFNISVKIKGAAEAAEKAANAAKKATNSKQGAK